MTSPLFPEMSQVTVERLREMLDEMPGEHFVMVPTRSLAVISNAGVAVRFLNLETEEIETVDKVAAS